MNLSSSADSHGSDDANYIVSSIGLHGQHPLKHHADKRDFLQNKTDGKTLLTEQQVSKSHQKELILPLQS